MKLVKFETAKLAHQKGFKLGQTKKYYNTISKKLYTSKALVEQMQYCVSAPYQSQLHKWLREEYGLIIVVITFRPESPGPVFLIPQIQTSRGSNFIYNDIVHKYNEDQERNTWMGDGETWSSDVKGDYEKALENGLQEALKLLKDENSRS